MLRLLKIKYFFLIIFFCATSGIFAQNETVLDSVNLPTFIDSMFLDHDLNNYSVRFYSSYKDSRFRISNDQENVTYAPSHPFGIGIGLASKKLIIDLGLNIKSRNQESTDRLDLQVTFMFKNHLVDYTFQRYQGYHERGKDGNNFRKDVYSFSTRLNYLYMFNAEGQSVTALKSGLYHQKKFAYSFGLGGFLFTNQLKADSSLIPTESASLFNEYAQITEFIGVGGGILGGFSLTYPFTSRLFISGTLTSGVGLLYKEVETKTNDYFPNNPMIYQANLAAVLGYNWIKSYVNISAAYGLLSTDLDFGNQVAYNITNTKLVFGYKFGKNKNKK